jgi:N-acetylated-alpha-linked acidic dipeptidase
VDSLTASASRYEKAYDGWAGDSSATASLAAINRRLLQSERLLTDEAGLPKRPWYQHLLYAPGFYTGYGVKTMPGVREAIEQGEWDAIDKEVQRLADVLNREAAAVDKITSMLAENSDVSP